MPVVKCKSGTCTKKYEIEKDEMIFTLSTTKKVEDLVEKKDYTELGKFVKNQVLSNTHSYTDKFDDLNAYKKQNETIYS
jgi:transcriptional antiterminator